MTKHSTPGATGTSIEVSSGAPPNDTTSSQDDTDHNESRASFLNRTFLEWADFLPSWSCISLYVIAGKYWNDCEVIPSVNVYLVVFPTVVLSYNMVKFVGRTERLKKQGGPMWPWLYLEGILTVMLLASAIWGAFLTFGNFHLKGNDGGNQCATAAFMGVFISVCITFFIFVAVFVFIIYIIVVEVKKEMAKEAAAREEENENAESSTDEETPETPSESIDET